VGNGKAPSSTDLTNAIVVVRSGVLAAVVLFEGFVIAARPATALPTYAEKEHKDCGYCHMNPNGGNRLSANGRRYEANGHTFSVPNSLPK